MQQGQESSLCLQNKSVHQVKRECALSENFPLQCGQNAAETRYYPPNPLLLCTMGVEMKFSILLYMQLILFRI